MMMVLNDVIVRCKACGAEIMIAKEDLPLADPIPYDHGENGMGEELMYSSPFEVSCCRCGNPISITIYGSEYPAGAFDSEDYDITGGECLDAPHLGIVYECEEFYDDCENEAVSLIQLIASNPSIIYTIDPRQFEEVVNQVLIDHGYETVLTPRTRDGGKDIIATLNTVAGPIVCFVECKRYGEKNSVGVNIVRSLLGVQCSEKVNQTVLVTTGHITSDAQEFVREQKNLMSVIDCKKLLELINNSAVMRNGIGGI